MLKTLDNGLKVWNEIDGTAFLAIDSSRLDECMSYVRSSDIKNVAINESWGFGGNDIDFLSQVADILEGLHLQETRVDYTVINSLTKLKILRFSDNENDVINLINFPRIEVLAADFTPPLQNVGKATNLKSLRLAKYKSNTKDISDLAALNQLTVLELITTNIESANGIQNLKYLEKLHIYRAPNLKDIKNLMSLENFTEIELQSCRSFIDYDCFAAIPHLEDLKLFKCGDIQSLQFIESMQHLQFLSFSGTNVVDGNLELLEHIKGTPYVSFDDKRHYNRKMVDFKESNALHVPRWKKLQEQTQAR